MCVCVCFSVLHAFFGNNPLSNLAYACLAVLVATNNAVSWAASVRQQVIVPTTACIYVLIGYLAGGTIMFAEWENWGYLDSCYFSFTSILKIGFGDFFPGKH